MHKSIVRRGFNAALAPLFGVGLLHCTFGDLNALGAGLTDSSAPQKSVTPGADASPDAASDESDDDSSSPDASGSLEATSSLDDAPGVDLSADAADAGDLDGPASDVADAIGDSAMPGSTVPAMAPPYWPDAGTQTWCGMQEAFVMHTFCADFDQTSLPAGFSGSDGQFLSETSSDAKSSPNDLLLYVPAQAAVTAGSFGSKLSQPFPTYSSTISLSFDVKPEVLDPTSGLLFAALDFLGNGAAKYSVRLAFNMGVPRLEESFLGNPPDKFHSNFALPAQVWSRVEVDITFAGDAGASTESISVNGVPAVPTETLHPPQGFDSRPNLLVGAVYGTTPNGVWVIRYDDVTLDIH
jgi:hypothetical protein